MERKMSWHALEYKQKEKTADWYWAVGIIALCLVVIAIISGDGLFAVFIILAVAILIAFSVREPKLVPITLDERGVTVGTDAYPFATLHEFWVDISEPENEKILLRSKKSFIPLVVIPITDRDHLAVREFLLKHLPEKELREPLGRKVMEKLGF
ncbi:MAG: hypothetical protein KGH93_00695 [Patescibacteria group bacterium]|nr:hypothetical protein [Patescibacteria group bacterium]MDE1945704.1 hypothetical protein [Patescibacteria group bacterium]